MTRRSPYQEMRSALLVVGSSERNRRALTYAPWLLCTLYLAVNHQQLATFEESDWSRLAALAAFLLGLAWLARTQLRRQREIAEAALERLVGTRAGISALNRLQTESPRYRQVTLSDRVQRVLVQTAYREELLAEEARERARSCPRSA